MRKQTLNELLIFKQENMKTLAIKNMVCKRCIMTVKNILISLDIPFDAVTLGRIILTKELNPKKMTAFNEELKIFGFEILTQKEAVIVERIKTVLLQLIEDQELKKKEQNISAILSESIGMNYSKISKLFSSKESKTIERYFIELKIEKVKELIRYEELSVSEISYELGYSTPQHLSRQFRQVTGMSSSEFKKNGKRKELDKI